MNFTEDERKEIYEIYKNKIDKFFDDIEWRVNLTYDETFTMTLESIDKYLKDKAND